MTGLVIDEVSAGYGPTKVLHGVSVQVQRGSIVALVGSNGAGKTSTIRAVAGLIHVTSGSVSVDGVDLRRAKPHARPAAGIGHVPEGRQLFAGMTVGDNLRLGAYRSKAGSDAALADVFDLFPLLAERQRARAGSLSGGQAQMLAIGRALMCRPAFLMLDEPSLGLSPMMVDRVFEAVHALRARDVGVLLAEQNASRSLGLADQAHVMEHGRIVLSGPGRELLERPEVAASYLGGAA